MEMEVLQHLCVRVRDSENIPVCVCVCVCDMELVGGRVAEAWPCRLDVCC